MAFAVGRDSQITSNTFYVSFYFYKCKKMSMECMKGETYDLWTIGNISYLNHQTLAFPFCVPSSGKSNGPCSLLTQTVLAFFSCLQPFFRGKNVSLFKSEHCHNACFFLITGAFFWFKIFLLKLNFTPNKWAWVKKSYSGDNVLYNDLPYQKFSI